ncbi:MAG: hypothetical protein GX535_02480 [Xanthomonadaceae bacterium]|nr:hypothetical protein [Xanthomonadaceae bacterium]
MSENAVSTGLFDAGRNCWRIERAERAAFLIDADAYFKAFVAAARKAHRSILITGWDFHSRTRLLCADERGRELELGRFLNDLVRRKRGLQIHILIWDYPMIFGLDREWAPTYGFGWKPRRRIQFRYDNTHPVGASHHQKIVVIDDALAFCGGIDLTCKRWDTCDHAPNDARRVVLGAPYPPFHDLMMAVDSDAAKSLEISCASAGGVRRAKRLHLPMCAARIRGPIHCSRRCGGICASRCRAARRRARTPRRSGRWRRFTSI